MASATRGAPHADSALEGDAAAGCVIELLRRDQRRDHEAATGRWIGERLARVLGHAYGGGAQFYAMWVVGAEKS